MGVHIKPCAKCRRAKGQRAKDKRSRKSCSDCKWIAITPPRLDRKSLGVFATKDAAEAALQEALVNHRRGIDLAPKSLTVRAVVERYLSDGVGQLSVTTVHRYRELWNLYGQNLGNHTVGDLRKAHITALYSRLGQDGGKKRPALSGRTVLHLHRVLHRAFAWAVSQDVLGANIFATVSAPRAAASNARSLTLDEAGAFFAAAVAHKFELFMRLAILTAARRGELVALKWDAVDLEAGKMMVRSAVASTRAKKAERRAGASATVIKLPKSGKTRDVPLDSEAIAVFRRLRALQAATKLLNRPVYRDDGFVFADEVGRPIKLDATTKAFREIANKAGLSRDLTLHSLRHTFASWSLSNGGDITAVQRVMGHSVPSTTLNLYSHAIEGGRERAVRAASDVFHQALQAERVSGQN